MACIPVYLNIYVKNLGRRIRIVGGGAERELGGGADRELGGEGAHALQIFTEPKKNLLIRWLKITRLFLNCMSSQLCFMIQSYVGCSTLVGRRIFQNNLITRAN